MTQQGGWMARREWIRRRAVRAANRKVMCVKEGVKQDNDVTLACSHFKLREIGEIMPLRFDGFCTCLAARDGGEALAFHTLV